MANICRVVHVEYQESYLIPSSLPMFMSLLLLLILPPKHIANPFLSIPFHNHHPPPGPHHFLPPDCFHTLILALQCHSPASAALWTFHCFQDRTRSLTWPTRPRLIQSLFFTLPLLPSHRHGYSLPSCPWVFALTAPSAHNILPSSPQILNVMD